jgi:hypothetical protein
VQLVASVAEELAAPRRQQCGPERESNSAARQALQLMTGLFWDLGEQAAALPRRRA